MTIRERAARERDQLLRAVGYYHRRPARALASIWAMKGYRISREVLPGNLYGELRPSQKEVVICGHLSKKLDFPKAAQGCFYQTSAHELAHEILHVGQVQNPGRREEWEADEFAREFLVPERQLLQTEGLQVIERANRGWLDLDSDQLWAVAINLAKEFHVTGALMRVQLYRLGYIEWDPKYREIHPRMRAVS